MCLNFRWRSLLKTKMMETKKVLTRENIPTEELSAPVTKVYKGIKLEYTEVFYLDNVVDEETGMINKDLKDRHYTKTQMERNIKALKNAYHIAKGSASPTEIIDFRKRYKISASTFSIILGFSKNTISNIETEGITSLSTGRLIKMCLENKNVVSKYVQLCDAIDKRKRDEISKRLMEEYT
jgi:DNA-binding transcriptional regulator YiaG